MQSEAVNNINNINSNEVLEPWKKELIEWTPIAETFNEKTERLVEIIYVEFPNRANFTRR